MNKGIAFEEQVLALLKKMGFDAEMTKTSGDGGIDIIAHKDDDIVGGKFVIQCKNWTKPVGEPAIRDLYGVVVAENANKGLLITQSSFTSQAMEFANGKHIELIDGKKLAQLFNKYGILDISEEDAATVNHDELIINDLKLQLSKSPQNIVILKSIGDIFLLRGDYEEAINYLSEILPLKPEIQTRRFQETYFQGLNNYGVALALSKNYDKAIAIFKKLREDKKSPGMNEAFLYHYLGLFDLAKKTYEQLRLYSSALDEYYELAYMSTMIETPSLVLEYLDENGQDNIHSIPLDTPAKKAREELTEKGFDFSFAHNIFEPINQIMATWEKSQYFELKTDRSKIYTVPGVAELNQGIDEWRQITSEYKSKLEPDSANEYAHIKNKMISLLVAVVEDYIKNLNERVDYCRGLHQEYSEDLWESLKKQFTSGSINMGAMTTTATLIEEFGRLLGDYTAILTITVNKWEKILGDERLYWQDTILYGRLAPGAFSVKIKGPDDRKQLYLTTKEFYKDAGVEFDKAKEFLTKGVIMSFQDKNKAMKFIEKYNQMGCKAELKES